MTCGHCRMLSGWLMMLPYVIRMRQLMWSLSHLDDLAIPSISSGWHMADALCHPDDLAGVGISSGRVTTNSLCHPDDILFHIMSSVWLNWGWYLIRMSYGNVIMSSGWHTLPPYVIGMTSLRMVSHPDELRQCYYVIRMTYASIFKSSGWDSKFRFSTTRGGPSALPYQWADMHKYASNL